MKGIAFNCRIALGALGVTLSSTLAAQLPALTESEVIRRALERPIVRELERSTIDIAEGERIEVQTWPNPVFSFDREQVSSGSGRTIERTGSLAQQFDVSGRRALRTEAARVRVDAARISAEAQRRRIAHDARRRFHDVLMLQSVRAAIVRWTERLAASEQLATTLQKGGDVAGYDRRRIVRERQTVEARLQSVEAELARARERLAALIGSALAPEQTLQGELLPGDPRPLNDLLVAARERPDLRAIALQADAFRHDASAAARAWIPDLTLGAGVRHIDTGMRSDSGIVLSVGVPLPLFDRAEGPRRRAAAQADQALAQLALERQQLEGELRGLWLQSRQLAAATRRFGSEALDGSQRLVQIAETAYRGGETTILDLLDAHRGWAEADTRAIELAHAARLARLELDSLAGEPTP